MPFVERDSCPVLTRLCLDGTGVARLSTGLPFLEHGCMPGHRLHAQHAIEDSVFRHAFFAPQVMICGHSVVVDLVAQEDRAMK